MCDEALLDQSHHCPACRCGSVDSHYSFRCRGSVFCAKLFQLEPRTREVSYPTHVKGKLYPVHCVELCLTGVVPQSISSAGSSASVYCCSAVWTQLSSRFYREIMFPLAGAVFPQSSKCIPIALVVCRSLIESITFLLLELKMGCAFPSHTLDSLCLSSSIPGILLL